MIKGQYQYETSPRKIDPEQKRNNKNNIDKKKKIKIVKDIPRQEIKISKEQRKRQIKLIGYAIIILAILLTISYRNSQINVKFTKIQSQKNELANIKKENEQAEVNIENSINLNNIEQQAKDKLAMEKLTNRQTVYVTLPKKDYIESASEKINKEEENKNWFQKIIDKILNK